MMKTTKKQQMLDEAAKAERLRILWMINNMIFSGDYPAAGLDALRNLHKEILDSSK